MGRPSFLATYAPRLGDRAVEARVAADALAVMSGTIELG
jgi:hypothetical protein